MIRSLEIRDLVVIEGAEIEPAHGLTVVTGETGAGKTVLAQALGLLAGGQADSGAVRPGARHALVQGTFALPDGFWERLADVDEEAAELRDLPDEPGEITIARRVPADGRARALLDGQTVPRGALSVIAGELLRFSGQYEQRRLTGPAAQLAALDAFVGTEAVALAQRLVGLRRRLAAAERTVVAARARAAEALRRRDELVALVEDVDALSPSPEDEAALRTERERLRHSERLLGLAAEAAEALDPETDEGGALARAGAAARLLADAAEIDEGLVEARDDAAAAEAVLQEAARALRSYLGSFEVAPGRLDDVQSRLEEYALLRRRHGEDLDEILAAAERARGDLADLEAQGAGEATAVAERDALHHEARAVADELHELRRAAAGPMGEAVVAELSELAMPAAVLRVDLSRTDDDPPRDRATLWLRANPGLPEAPLADVASGGELSRVLLALHGVAAAADPAATWVFDEVDAGIGGTTAGAVGAKLVSLARGRQVVVITHLPQIAALGERHYRLVKGLDDDGRATTRIESVEGDTLVAELCRMLGAGEDDTGARRHAEELVARRGEAHANIGRRARPRSARAR